MNLLEKICKELGVEIGEKWLASDGYYYHISEIGEIGVFNTNDEILSHGYMYWEDIFNGLVRPIWKPITGGYYWTVEFDEIDKVYKYSWHNSDVEQMLLKRGLVFKTKEEAMNVANKMLKTLAQ